MRQFPLTRYADILSQMREYWVTASIQYGLPCYPDVSMGWDPSLRTVQSDVYDNSGYPFTPILKGNTQMAFQIALQTVKDFLDARR